MPTEMNAAEAAEVLEGTDFVEERAQEAIDYAASLCRKLAAGELREVRHAEWKLVSAGTRCNLVKCTNCGHSVAVTNTVPLDEWRASRPYCDQCGALMDEKDGETSESTHAKSVYD